MEKGVRFELTVAEYHRRKGYEAELTPHSHDYGADIILFFNHKKIVVQVKYLSDGKVSIGAVQEIAGAIKHFNADEGWVITNSTFTKNAIELANSNKIQLIENFSDDLQSDEYKIPYKSIAILGIILLLALSLVVFLSPFFENLDGGQNAKLNSYIQKGDEFYFSDQYLEAINQYDSALSIAPNLALLWFNKGVCLEQLSRFEDALNCYNNAIKINPAYAQAWNNKGGLLLSLKRSNEACQALERAYALEPNDPLISSNYEKVKQMCNF